MVSLSKWWWARLCGGHVRRTGGAEPGAKRR